jgi:hypothetical protein
MIEITETTRWADLSDEQKAQLTEEQVTDILQRDLIDPKTGKVYLE